MTPCPNSTESGCRCPEHAPGLLETSSDPDGLAAALERLKPRRLHVVTMPADRDPCAGTMTCRCQRCVKDRVSIQPREVRQPWEPKRRAA